MSDDTSNSPSADSQSIDKQLFDAARSGDTATLTRLLNQYPDKLHVREEPYEWSLLHRAAAEGHLDAVDLLLQRGMDANDREKGDNTYPMHWAAAGGRTDIVKRLADAGGDVIGEGDDHKLAVIGGASCWDGCDDPAHREVGDLLISRGARHHIFSAIAFNLANEVRKLVSEDPSRLERLMSHNENFQRPLHFAVRFNRPEMVALLVELGADPLGKDGTGNGPAAYATTPGIDKSVMMAQQARGNVSLLSALALNDWEMAEKIVREHPEEVKDAKAGVLHIMAKRNHLSAVKWLLERGADPNARWDHFDALVTPLHLAVWQGHTEVVRVLLQHGADPSIHDSLHDSDVVGWAEFAGRHDIVRILMEHGQTSTDVIDSAPPGAPPSS